MTELTPASSPTASLRASPDDTASSQAPAPTKKTSWKHSELKGILNAHYAEWIRLPLRAPERKLLMDKIQEEVAASPHWKQTTDLQKVSPNAA